MSDMLFDGYEADPLPHKDPALSADRRLTLRQQANITTGIHPLTRGALHDQADRHANKSDGTHRPLTCGTCIHRESFRYHNGTYPKCVAHSRAYVVHSAATDVRGWWPACPSYLPTGAQS